MKDNILNVVARIRELMIAPENRMPIDASI
jgi:hypothetical protein